MDALPHAACPLSVSGRLGRFQINCMLHFDMPFLAITVSDADRRGYLGLLSDPFLNFDGNSDAPVIAFGPGVRRLNVVGRKGDFEHVGSSSAVHCRTQCDRLYSIHGYDDRIEFEVS